MNPSIDNVEYLSQDMYELCNNNSSSSNSNHGGEVFAESNASPETPTELWTGERLSQITGQLYYDESQHSPGTVHWNPESPRSIRIRNVLIRKGIMVKRPKIDYDDQESPDTYLGSKKHVPPPPLSLMAYGPPRYKNRKRMSDGQEARMKSKLHDNKDQYIHQNSSQKQESTDVYHSSNSQLPNVVSEATTAQGKDDDDVKSQLAPSTDITYIDPNTNTFAIYKLDAIDCYNGDDDDEMMSFLCSPRESKKSKVTISCNGIVVDDYGGNVGEDSQYMNFN